MNAIEIYENAIRMFEINGEITLGEFEEMIKPLEDVAPVVHGKWILNDDQVYECNDCGYIPSFDGYTYFNYCPNCGARMDGGR